MVWRLVHIAAGSQERGRTDYPVPMIDLVVNVFRLTNGRFLMAPKVEFGYQEKGIDVNWHVAAGGTRAYLLRFGGGLAQITPDSIGEQSADSHFMISRLQSALLLGGKGLFQAEAVGRVFLKEVQATPEWFTQLDLPTTLYDRDVDGVYDWLTALVQHPMLRRAAADAHMALSTPHEAAGFVYRGFEWLIVGEGRRWEDLSVDTGIPHSQMRDFKKLANVDHGVRHASQSGKKLRADTLSYGSWVCALLEAIGATRSRLDPAYSKPDASSVAQAVVQAMAVNPFP